MKGGKKGDGDDGQHGEDDGEEDEEREAEFCGPVGVGKVHIEDAKGVKIGVNG
jgi:hypothetical protein